MCDECKGTRACNVHVMQPFLPASHHVAKYQQLEQDFTSTRLQTICDLIAFELHTLSNEEKIHNDLANYLSVVILNISVTMYLCCILHADTYFNS